MSRIERYPTDSGRAFMEIMPGSFADHRGTRRPTLRERILAAYEDRLDDVHFARRRFSQETQP